MLFSNICIYFIFAKQPQKDTKLIKFAGKLIGGGTIYSTNVYANKHNFMERIQKTLNQLVTKSI